MNAYRCWFGVDVELVPGGCVNGWPAAGPSEPGAGGVLDAGALGRLVAEQEALLNAYRCRFGVDTQAVPGGCRDGVPATGPAAEPQAGTPRPGGGAGEVGDPAAVCFERFGFAREPLAVAKVPGSQRALAEVSWKFGADGGCRLVLDDEAAGILRSGVSAGSQLVWGSALPDLSLGEPSAADREAAEHCYEMRSPFARQPVDVAWAEDATTALAQVKWAHNDAIGCYLVLNDNAAAVLAYAAGGPVVLAAGGNTSCVVRVDRTLGCWGSGYWDREVPPPAGRFVEVAVGVRHFCAIRVGGAVVCWGLGSLDHGQADAPEGRFASIAAGERHSCAIGADGAVVCWGDRRLGKADAPEGMFTAVAAGANHTCAIGAGRAVVCWGDDTFGQTSAPPGEFTAIAAGDYHTCAIRADRSLACWGERQDQPPPPTGEFTAVSAGPWHTCAIRADRSLACWGHANLGHGQADAPGGEFVAVAAGTYHSCAIRADRTVACWGHHDDTGAFPAPAPIQAVYAIPAGERPVAGRKRLIADAVADAQEWFRSQTGGRDLLFQQDPGGVSVVTVELSDRGGNIERVVSEVFGALGSRPPLIIFGEGEFPAAGKTHGSCAHGGPMVMISIRRCRQDYPPGELAWIVAHELVHLLGAATDCAPNYAGLGHVDDDRRDILFYQHTGLGFGRLVLDVGRDDYYGHGRHDCYDIADNPLWASPAPEARAESGADTPPQPRWQPTEGTIDAVHRTGAPRLRDEVRWVNGGAWCTSAASTSASLSWLDLGGVARTEVAYGRGFGASQGRFDLNELRDATKTSATVDGLRPNTSYSFGVVTYGADGAPLDGFHTQCQTANREFLACPQTHVTETSLRFEWDPVPGVEGYAVVYSHYHYVGTDPAQIVIAAGNSIELGGLMPGSIHLLNVLPLRVVFIDNANSHFEGKVFPSPSAAEDAVESIAEVIRDSDIILFDYGGRGSPYIHCHTLSENARARCADVGATSLTYEWDPVPRASVYVVRIDAYLHNGVNNHYWTTGTSWAFDGLVPGRTYDIRAEAYPAHYLEADDAIAPGRWITDDWAQDAGAYVDVDSMVPGSYGPSMDIYCQTQRKP